MLPGEKVTVIRKRCVYIWVFPKIGGKPPKKDGENHGKPYFLMDDLGVPLFLETPIYI